MIKGPDDQAVLRKKYLCGNLVLWLKALSSYGEPLQLWNIKTACSLGPLILCLCLYLSFPFPVFFFCVFFFCCNCLKVYLYLSLSLLALNNIICEIFWKKNLSYFCFSPLFCLKLFSPSLLILFLKRFLIKWPAQWELDKSFFLQINFCFDLTYNTKAEKKLIWLFLPWVYKETFVLKWPSLQIQLVTSIVVYFFIIKSFFKRPIIFQFNLFSIFCRSKKLCRKNHCFFVVSKSRKWQ